MVDYSAAAQLADGRVMVVGNCLAEAVPRPPPATAIYGPSGWSSAATPPFCVGTLAALPSGRAIFVARGRAAIYDANLNRWIRLPGYRFPHGRTSFPPEVLQIAAVPGGALLVDRGLNRFSSAERFLERFLP